MKKLLLTAAAGLIMGSATAVADNYEHFIMYGQSLSTGHQSWPVVSTENVSGNYMLGSQIWYNYGNGSVTAINPLKGTVARDFASQPKTRGAGTIAECPLLGAVNHLQLAYPGTKILATSDGVSGKTIEQLSKPCTYSGIYNTYLQSLKTAKRLAGAEGNTVTCPAIFWMQGEYNGRNANNADYTWEGKQGMTSGSIQTFEKEGYKELLIKLKDNMLDDAASIYGQSDEPIFITYQTGAQYLHFHDMPVSMAQLEAANEDEDIIMAGPVYPLPDRGGHLDANGYRWYGEMLAKVYHQTQVEHKDFMPLQPVKIAREGNNKLRITYHVPNPPLAFDTNLLPETVNYGFRVIDGKAKPTSTEVATIDISKVEIDGNDVVLTCARNLPTNVSVSYAGPWAVIKNQPAGVDDNMRGHGNLRDSDPYPSKLSYIDLDAKDAQGRYVYARAASETTLRPNYEPKDATGKVIYGKPYPLYNWGVAFYYELDGKNSITVTPKANRLHSGGTVKGEDEEEITEADLSKETADWYVSATKGNDSNAGNTASAPFATLAKALASVSNGQTIVFTGKQTISAHIAVEGKANVAILGAGDKASANVITADNCQPIDALNCSLTFKNITFKDGYMVSGNGTALSLRGGTAEIIGCTFTGNRTTGANSASGTLFMSDLTSATIDKCRFTKNATFRGGAIFAAVTNMTLTDCEFTENYLVGTNGDPRGAAIFADNVNMTLTGCTIRGNSAGKGGAAAFICGNNNNTAIFDRCAILENVSGDHGGAFFVDHGGPLEMSFINSTLTLNNCANAGATIFYVAGNKTSSLNFIQSSMVRNWTDNNSGNCGGIRFISSPIKVNVTNSIIEGNYGLGGNTRGDICIEGCASIPIDVKNSVIGKFALVDPTNLTKNAASIVNTSPELTNADANEAGLSPYLNEKYLCYPFLNNDSKGTKMADLSLNPETLTLDQLGQKRTLNYIGAVQLLEGDSPQSGISQSIADKSSGVAVSIIGGVIRVESDATTSRIAARIISLNGATVASASAYGSVLESDAQLAAGIYLVNVVTDSNSVTVKLLVR